jgi:hypothetical protein
MAALAISSQNAVNDLETTKTHWGDWNEAVSRDGLTKSLKLASKRLSILDSMSVEEVEMLFQAMEIMESGELPVLRFTHCGEPVEMSSLAVFGNDFLTMIADEYKATHS